MKGKTIYIVILDSSYDEGVTAFENYGDALNYAHDQANDFIIDVDCEEQYIDYSIKEVEQYQEGKETISNTPFRAYIKCDNSAEDYCNITIVKETIK